jgi:hypothetical protein
MHMASKVVKKFGLVPLFLAGVIFGSALTGTAFAYQGHMWSALHALQNAQAQLNAAAHDKGGHRESALDLVNQAIGQVNQGIEDGGK